MEKTVLFICQSILLVDVFFSFGVVLAVMRAAGLLLVILSLPACRCRLSFFVSVIILFSICDGTRKALVLGLLWPRLAVLVPANTEIFLSVGVVAILLLFVAEALVKIIAGLGLVGGAAPGALNFSELFLAVGKGASKVSLTETGLKLRTYPGLEEPIEIGVVELHTAALLLRLFGVQAFLALFDLEKDILALFYWRLLYYCECLRVGKAIQRLCRKRRATVF